MAVEYDGVVGRTGEKASDLFGRSKESYQGATAVHRPNDLALACPTCRASGNAGIRLYARLDVGYYCMNGHKWKDMDELMSLNPTKLPYVGIKTKQEGWRELKIEMPGSTLDALQAKFGDKLSETLAAFIGVLTDGRSLVVGEEDLVRIEQHLGSQIRNGRELTGLVYERVEKVRELQEQVEKPSTPQPSVGFNIPGVIPVNVIDVIDKLEERARAADPPVSVSQFLTEKIRENISQGWW